MADNTTLNPGSSGDVIGSDDIGGVKFQRIKMIHGVDGVNDGDISTSNPLPVLRPDTAVSGNLTALNSTLELDLNNHGSVAFELTGTWVGTVRLEATVNGSVWAQIGIFKSGFNAQPISSTIENGQYRAVCPSAFAKVRLIMAAYTSGTATATMNASAATQYTLDFAGVDIEENESTTPLGAGATFTGAWVSTLNYNCIVVSVNTDKSGTIFIDFAGEDLVTTKTETHTFGIGGGLNIHPIQNEMMRIRVTNTSAEAQTTLAIHSFFKKYGMSFEFQELEADLDGESMAGLVRGVILAADPAGAYKNVGMTALENFKTSMEEVRGWRKEFAYDGSGNLQYIGKADPGSTTASSVWQIKKLVYSGGNLVQELFADGDQLYNNIWDNRASLSYS